MGRMLEALQQREAKAKQAQSTQPTLHTIWPDEGSSKEHLSSQEIPFVEVGAGEILTNDAVSDSSMASHRADGSTSWMTVRFRPLPLERSIEHGYSHFAPELIVFHDPEHPASRQYRDLAQSLLLHLPSVQAKILLFTSSSRGVGTTTALLNSAITLAQQENGRVLVIDACAQHGTIAEKLGVPDSPGLAEVLAGKTTLRHARQQTGVEHLHLLPAGNFEPRKSRRLVGEKMHNLLHEARELADWIFIDGPCWEGRPEMVALASECDAVYLCVPEHQQDSAEMADLVALITEQGAPLSGCILTSR